MKFGQLIDRTAGGQAERRLDLGVESDGARAREERGRERREGVKKREAQGRKSGREQGVLEHICTHTYMYIRMHAIGLDFLQCFFIFLPP